MRRGTRPMTIEYKGVKAVIDTRVLPLQRTFSLLPQTPRRCSRPHRWHEVGRRPFPAFGEQLGQKQRGRAGHAAAAARDEA